VKREPRIDAYIARAQPFAQPILAKVRERVHSLVPDIEETMKWSHPAFCRNGKIVLGTAAFKGHAAVNFWRGQELGLETRAGAMGQLGRLTSLEDLPADLDVIIARAAALSDAPAPRKPKAEPKAPPDMHPDFAAALENAPRARQAFESFAPGHRREYLEWVAEAKQDTTRQKRIASALEWLAEGKRRNWKYENC
jgi:uncharacterized protein YdeI (YjbR/CyaY-like superfamily)